MVETLTVRISPGARHELQELADHGGKTLSATVEHLIGQEHLRFTRDRDRRRTLPPIPIDRSDG